MTIYIMYISWLVFLVMLVVTAAERHTDKRWEKQPAKNKYGVLAGDNSIQLQWQYTSPDVMTDDARLLFTRKVISPNEPYPDADFVDFLLDASKHTSQATFTPSVIDTDVVRVDIRDNLISITVLSMGFHDTGQYQLNITFDRNKPDIHDTIELVVYERPEITVAPETEITKQLESHVTLRYVLTHGDRYPDVTSIVLSLSPINDVTYQDEMMVILVQAQWTLTWQVIYPEDSSQFNDRVILRYDNGVLGITLWHLQASDSGRLELTVTFGDELVSLKTVTRLTVADQDFHWVETPAFVVHVVQKHDTSLVYEAANDTHLGNQSVQYHVYKITQRDGRQRLFQLISTSGRIAAETLGTMTDRLQYSYTNSRLRLVLTFHNVTQEVGAKYHINMMYGDVIVLTHTFTIILLQEKDLYPEVQRNQTKLDISDKIPALPGYYRFYIPQSAPAATLTLSDTHTQRLYAVATDARALEILLQAEDITKGVTLNVQYGFYQKTLAIDGYIQVTQKSAITSDQRAGATQANTSTLIIWTLVLVLISCGVIIVTMYIIMRRHTNTIKNRFITEVRNGSLKQEQNDPLNGLEDKSMSNV